MIICSEKSEVVIDDVTSDVIDKLIRFNNSLAQTVLDYIATNGDPFEISIITRMKNLNIIDQSNQLNFHINNPTIIETPSI